MKTAEDITDAEIRDLAADCANHGDYYNAMWCDYALISPEQAERYFVPMGCDRHTARARCADLINTRTKEQR